MATSPTTTGLRGSQTTSMATMKAPLGDVVGGGLNHFCSFVRMGRPVYCSPVQRLS